MSRYTDAAGWAEWIGGNAYVVREALVWEIGREGSGLCVTVPAGERFDVSVPRPFRLIFSPRDPRYRKAAALHDHLLGLGWSRVTAGAVFQEALKADGVGAWRRLVMWGAVSVWRWQ